MNKSIQFLIFLLIFYFSGVAQKINGIISIQNSKYKTGKIQYIPGAMVEADSTNPSTTDVQGNFILDFPGVKMPKPLSVIKKGMEVINTHAVENFDPTKENVIKVFMSPIGNALEEKKRYYKISDSALTAVYQKKIKVLEKESKERKLLISELEKVWGIKINDIDEVRKRLSKERAGNDALANQLADNFSKINLDELIDAYIRAFDYYLAGQPDSTLSILNKEDLKKSSDKIVWEEKNIHEQKTQLIQSWLLRARTTLTKGDVLEADSAYLSAIVLDTTNIEIKIEHANFYEYINKIKKAKTIYESVLKSTANTLTSVKVLFRLGNMHQNNYLYKEAETYYLFALDICNKYKGVPEMELTRQKAQILTRLGEIFKAFNEFGKSQLYFEQAIVIYQKLPSFDSYTMLTVLNLFELHFRKDNISSLNLLLQNLFANKSNLLRVENEEYYTQYMLTILEKLLEVGIEYGTNKNGTREFEKNVESLEHLEIMPFMKYYNKNPAYHKVSLAKIYTISGLMLTSLKSYPKAEEKYKSALTIYKEKSADHFDAYLLEIANLLNNLGVVYIAEVKPEKADSCFRESIHLYKKSNEFYGDGRFDIEVTDVETNIGINLKEADQTAKAIVQLSACLKSYDSLNQKHHNFFLKNKIKVLDYLSAIYEDLDAPVKKIDISYNKFLARIELFRLNLSCKYFNSWSGEAFKLADSCAYYKKYDYSLSILKELATINNSKFMSCYTDSSDLKYALCILYGKLGWYSLLSNKPADALTNINLALKNHDSLYQTKSYYAAILLINGEVGKANLIYNELIKIKESDVGVLDTYKSPRELIKDLNLLKENKVIPKKIEKEIKKIELLLNNAYQESLITKPLSSN